MAAKKGLAIVIGGKPPGGMPPGMDDPNQPPGKMPDSAGASDPSDLTGDNAPDNVPLSALAMPDDTEQMQPPEVGDEVNYQVTGKVISIEGDVAQVQKTAVNGQPVGGADDSGDDQQPGDADEGQSLRSDAASMGMLAILIALWLALAASARAQSTTVWGNASLTNMLPVSTAPVKLYAVMGYNSSGSSEFVQIFSNEAKITNGTIPIFSFPVGASQYFSFDFSYYGADLDNVLVAASSTSSPLTLAAASTSIQAITKSR